MVFKVKSNILGFENITEVEFFKIDDLFYTIKDVKDSKIAFTMVNPYLLRNYEFDLPNSLKVLLDINDNSEINVYNIAVIKDPLDESSINFLAPLIFNKDNQTMAQVALNYLEYPAYGFAEPLKLYSQK
jgi:flagellar assembly factor FliW